MRRNTLDTFFARLHKREDGCWEWTHSRNPKGYGMFRIKWNGKQYLRAHQFSFERFRGPIPDGKLLDHVVCDTPECVNPQHLEPSTNKENVLRGTGPTAINAKKTHCKNGHPYNRVNKNGSRYCTCRNKPGGEQ